MWHGYFGVEDLNLSTAQRRLLIGELRSLGPASDPQPARLCHWRTRLDGNQAILEALFNEDNLTVDKFKQRLGSIFSVDPEDIESQVNSRWFAGGSTPVVVFGYGGTDYLRFALFGGLLASWQESGDECRGYLAASIEEWEFGE